MDKVNNSAIARGSRRHNDALVAKMYADYQDGMTMAEVGLKYGGRSMSAVYALFKHRGLPRRARMLPSVWLKVAATRRAHLDELVGRMYADYTSPMSLNAVAAKYGRTRGNVRELFQSRGLQLRVVSRAPRRLSNGQIAPYIPLTADEIDSLISSATRMVVPDALKFEWRQWSLERRRDFVRRLRARVNPPDTMPTTPLSEGLEPFEYGHPRAHAIADRENAGCGSHPKCSIKISSQGVIFRDQLWFWSPKVGYERGPWTPESGRPSLHRVLYQEAHGPIPESHVVRFADGNPNNLSPDNLVLASRNTVLRETQAAVLTKRSRAHTALLLDRAQNHHRNGYTQRLVELRAR